MKKLPKLLRKESVDYILSMPNFQERIQLYLREGEKFRKFLLNKASQEGNAIVIDFRGVDSPPIGNRFLEYVLYPEQNISIRLVDGKNQRITMISVGHSIISKTSKVNVGSLTLQYGGGGSLSSRNLSGKQ